MPMLTEVTFPFFVVLHVNNTPKELWEETGSVSNIVLS